MLIDSHAHVTHENYEESPQEIIDIARKNGVEKIINISTSLEDSKKSVAELEDIADIYTTIGIYPHENQNIPIEELISDLKILAQNSTNVVGIGECGIDIVDFDGIRPIQGPNGQIALFKAQIDLALQLNLPVIIHNRNADAYILEVLEGYKNTNLKSVVHCFTSDWDFGNKILDLGHYISFSGIVTYKSGEGIHETVAKIPSNKYLLETDAPYLAPTGHRGEKNYPHYVKIIAEKVATIRNSSLEQVENESYKNSVAFFNL